MNGIDPNVLIMAKAPRPGMVNTRLEPLLGPLGCAELQATLIRHTTTTARQVAPLSTYLAIDPPDAVGGTSGLVPVEVLVFAQRAGHLGVRLAAATETVLSGRPGPLVVIGADAPTLTAQVLIDAADMLDGYDVVFGPAVDGGYYLAAVCRWHRELFAIEPTLWGGPRVLAASVAAARRAGLTVGLLPCLRDLDTPEDAAMLLTDPLLPGPIAALLTSATAPP